MHQCICIIIFVSQSLNETAYLVFVPLFSTAFFLIVFFSVLDVNKNKI